MKISTFLTRLRHRLWSTTTSLLFIHEPGDIVTIPEEKRCPGEMRLVTEDNIMDCAAFEDASYHVPIYRNMIAMGDEMYYGYLEGQCVYRQGVQVHGTFTCDGCVTRHLKENEVYSQYGYCDPAARGNHFLSSGLVYVFSIHSDKRFYALVDDKNPASIKEHLRAGCQIYSLLTVKNRLFHRRLTETRLTPEQASQYDPNNRQSEH